ncbi:MAG: ribonuclease III, partial [Oscillospiraceae bacterium]|nr:ribonuclease III [Oscillospiraceae bacterium]
SAPAQARAAERIRSYLTAEEEAVYRRGKNARVGTVPQSASHAEYHSATGLETLFGYLYLRGEMERLGELFGLIVGESHFCV